MDTSTTEVKPPIDGHRTLKPSEIALINEIKLTGVLLQSLIDLVTKHVDNEANKLMDFEELNSPANKAELERMLDAQPHKWISRARIDLQTGLMKLTRAVAQPNGF
jgi:hypothetical protein